MASEALIHLIATFDHNTGTTACGLELDTWTIKYPDLTGALQYGYAKGEGLELFKVNCEICLNSDTFKYDKSEFIKFLYDKPLEVSPNSKFWESMPEDTAIIWQKAIVNTNEERIRMRKEYEELGLQNHIERSS